MNNDAKYNPLFYDNILWDLNDEIEKLNMNIKEKELIIDRTKEYLFILENEIIAKNKKIDKLLVENKELLKKINQLENQNLDNPE